MTIIDTVKQPGYTQWIEGFVTNVLENANITATITTISKMYNMRIYLFVDGREYMIHTKCFYRTGRDENGITNSEDVKYILYFGHEECEEVEDPITLNQISSGVLSIHWDNSDELYEAEVAQYYALHGKPEEPSAPQEGEYIVLHVEDLNNSTWDLNMDIRSLAPDEVLAAIEYLTSGDMPEEYHTPKMMRYINSVHESCVRSLLGFCFEFGKFDQDYTKRLISGCAAYKLCCVDCAINTYLFVCQQDVDTINSNRAAANTLKASLGEFFMNTQPYAISAA